MAHGNVSLILGIIIKLRKKGKRVNSRTEK